MDMRRTAITEMVEAGVDTTQIMAVSGHNSPQSMRPTSDTHINQQQVL